jgi:hypothetical protein
MALGIVLSSSLRGGWRRAHAALIGALEPREPASGTGCWCSAARARRGSGPTAPPSRPASPSCPGAAVYLGLWRRDRLAVGAAPGSTASRRRLRRILRIGMPTVAEQFAWQLGLFVFLRVVAG